jgi:predicted nucleic acid-binding Zn ribbon protein
MGSAENKKELYHYRREHGLCTLCGRKVDEDRAMCRECREEKNGYRRRYAKKKRFERREQGLCTVCGKPLEEENVRVCKECRTERSKQRAKNSESLNAYRRNKTKEYKERGLCVYCGTRKAREGKVACEECAEKMNAKNRENYRRMQKMGMCACGNRLFGQEKTCPECLARKSSNTIKWYNNLSEEEKTERYERQKIKGKERRERYKTEHKCTICGRKILEGDNHVTCFVCREKASERRQRKPKKIKPYGTCRFCDKPVFEDHKVCEEHYRIGCEKVAYARQFNKAWEGYNKILFTKKKVEE